MNLASLNPQQRDAVLHTDGPLLLLAGAGSGKTRVITTRVAYLLHKKGIPAEAILAVTFTNKAAREMAERIVALAGKRRAEGVTVSTFHALGVRILRSGIERLGYKKNFSIYAASDQLRLLRDLVRDCGGQRAGVDADRVLWKISDAKNRLVDHRRFRAGRNDPAGDIAARVYPRYQQALRACNAVDFDDILMLSTTLLLEHEDLRAHWQERFSHVMVDEYQDTNFAQYQLLRLLCDRHRNLCVVGDDDQSIYGWRGADPGNILEFDRDYPDARVIRLEQNYRSTSTILDAANAVIRQNSKRHDKSLWSAAGAGEKIDLIVCRDDEAEAGHVSERIAALRDRLDCGYDAFAILYRTNAQARIFEETLRRDRIPYVLIGGQQFFDRKEVKDALAYLSVLVNPHDEVNLLRILNYPKRGIGETTAELLIQTSAQQNRPLWELIRHPANVAGIGDKTAVALKAFAELLERYRALFACTSNLSATCRELIREIGMEDDIWRSSENIEQGKRRLAFLTEVGTSLEAYERRAEKPDLREFLERVALLERDDQNRDDKEEKLQRGAVVLMSLHASKGLEFPHVFLVGLEEEILPLCTADGEEADIEEERRLLYVGITRARQTLTLLAPKGRMKYGKLRPRKPSRFLAELPENLLSRLDCTRQQPANDAPATADDFFARMRASLED